MSFLYSRLGIVKLRYLNNLFLDVFIFFMLSSLNGVNHFGFNLSLFLLKAPVELLTTHFKTSSLTLKLKNFAILTS